jgi:hypothetical protein
VRNAARPAARVSTSAIATIFGLRLPKIPASVRPCTDIF